MTTLVKTPKGLHGEVLVPGDKSISHRVIMLGALSEGETKINHFLFSDDCLSTVNAFRDLGVKIDIIDEHVIVHGVGFNGLEAPKHELQMGNSGTTTRLIMGILSGQNFSSELIGDDSLSKRPMNRVSEPLATMGAEVITTDGHLPAIVNGKQLHSTNYQMKVASAQVKSALIFAALQANEPSIIREKLPTRNHTETMLNAFGGKIVTSEDQLTITVNPQPRLKGIDLTVPGDISSAAFFIAAGLLVPNSQIRLQRVGINETRTGILDVVKRMGGNIQLENINRDGEPLADLVVTSSQLTATDISAEKIPAMIDELPIIALLCARAAGTSTISGAEELRVKETDRIAAITEEFKKLGIDITEKSDGFVINGSQDWHVESSQLNSHGDHRIGMTLAVADLLVDTHLELAGKESVSISYPDFFDDLARLI
ncbi:3-phosphoshikimate 1-carboxyvinyltransferase [Lentilactobacillus curieae]|uniref:3-phosphoshikimate 1-carboxyvinyltransferase n=1 Tax=Lentilactobacillus curieae TaxID=1138822 RepID=A0A1S6QGB8_9LACO|nr:3-phosphoshikimate 1-carboxyvinyltransferase [Lentilactobacillus curieae]AQW20657.1 3-phosphoshikimate 1-carboxyvinyltransferase [Lentilactobacillus curieae]